MKKIFYLLAILTLPLLSHEVSSQDRETIMAEAADKDPFTKKFRWGLSWNQYWGVIKGNPLPQTYFAKPCIGFNLRAEYYPLSFVGIGAGFGIQQRGAGIINPDTYGGAFTHPWILPQFDADSTYRERLRFTGLELPVTLLFRTPFDVIKGMRLSAGAGLFYTKIYKSDDFFLSVEDGYHKSTNVASDYLTNDLGYQFSVGADINGGGSCLFQVHLVYTRGTKNVYRTFPGNGQLETYGFRVACLF